MNTLMEQPRRQKKYRQSGLAVNFPSVPINLEFWRVSGEDFMWPLDIMLSEDEPGHYEADDVFRPEEMDQLPEIKTPDVESLQAEVEALKLERDESIERAQQLAEVVYELRRELDRKKKTSTVGC
jgi:hypothetical protein